MTKDAGIDIELTQCGGTRITFLLILTHFWHQDGCYLTGRRVDHGLFEVLSRVIVLQLDLITLRARIDHKIDTTDVLLYMTLNQWPGR